MRRWSESGISRPSLLICGKWKPIRPTTGYRHRGSWRKWTECSWRCVSISECLPCKWKQMPDACPLNRRKQRQQRTQSSRHTPCAVRKLRHTECAYYFLRYLRSLLFNIPHLSSLIPYPSSFHHHRLGRAHDAAGVAPRTLFLVDRMLYVGRHRDRVDRALLGAQRAADALVGDPVFN